MSLLSRLLGERKERERLAPLYRAVVEAGRAPAWYLEGGVPDTVEGRFDMIASLLALVLIRLEHEGQKGAAESVLLTEAFIDDMDGSLRQLGIGDFVVGKHVGKLMGALGGRLQAYRVALEKGEGMDEAVRRNIFRDAPPSEEALAFVAAGLRRIAQGLGTTTLEHLLEGAISSP
jgi:cytochrome b pre-mRNA-processing protein 3